MIPTLLGVSILIFLLMRVVPGDLVFLKLSSGGGSFTQEYLQSERAKIGLDKPLWYQYGSWIGGSCRGTSENPCGPTAPLPMNSAFVSS
jgi:peptide/nickel transport system permease protein